MTWSPEAWQPQTRILREFSLKICSHNYISNLKYIFLKFPSCFSNLSIFWKTCFFSLCAFIFYVYFFQEYVPAKVLTKHLKCLIKQNPMKNHWKAKNYVTNISVIIFTGFTCMNKKNSPHQINKHQHNTNKYGPFTQAPSLGRFTTCQQHILCNRHTLNLN